MEIICRRNKIRDRLQTDTEGRRGSGSGSPWANGSGAEAGSATAALGDRASLSPSPGLQVLLWNTGRTKKDNADPVPSTQSALSKRSLGRDQATEAQRGK